jgi:2-(1,2-epoxy-1,2-dihydrophenyl)acetyl-CoA isomerase
MKFSAILFDKADAVASITLNRPERLNAFTQAMLAELHQALDAIEHDPAIRALLLTGAGRGFCAGQDLGERAPGAGVDLGSSLEKNYNPLLKRLRALPFPVVCAVNGVAAGAGCNLALACDIVVACRSASFIQAFIKIGLIPDAGGTYTLPRLVGSARAVGLAMLGEPLPAERAAQWGLIWRCVEDTELERESRELCQRLAAQPTRAIALIKQALQASPNHSFEQQLDLEARLQNQAGKTEDFTEGVRAFLEKRPARFTGR